MRFCYVGHKFHTKTRSNAFFLDFIKDLGEVSEFLSSPDEPESADDGLIRELGASDFDCYVFWQTEYIAERLIPMGLGRFLIAPMYDGAVGRPQTFWRQFIDAQFISFSRVHHEVLQRAGCRSAYFRYFPEPKVQQRYDFTGALSAFFWERRPGQEPSLQTILELCKQIGIEKLHVHAAPDTDVGSVRSNWPEEFELEGIKITVSRWFDSRKDLETVMNRAQFNFAPRALEGIGMSFLEAMAIGQIVIAPDKPTMNEYISHQTNGLLYSFENFRMDFSPAPQSLERISSSALRTVKNGWTDWQQDQDRLKSIVLADDRRWSTKDSSSHFRNLLRRRAAERVRSA